jgi:hypothetical protein
VGQEQRLFSQAPKIFYPHLAISQTIVIRNRLFISLPLLLCSREQNLPATNPHGQPDYTPVDFAQPDKDRQNKQPSLS